MDMRNSDRKPAEAPAHRALAGATAALQELAASVERAARRRLGRSLSIREVDAGSCNGCELEIHALGNAFYDLERFGLRFVASPRHADVLLVTGPVTKNMREALQRTYDATPDPKWVVAVGDCAVDGGIFSGSYAVAGGVHDVRAGRPAYPRLPAEPHPIAQGAAGSARAAVRRLRFGIATTKQKCMAPERWFIENTIREQWIGVMVASKPCSARGAGEFARL